MARIEQLYLFAYGGCTSCNYVGYFEYVGEQMGYKDIPPLLLYNCGECSTTLNLERILNDILDQGDEKL